MMPASPRAGFVVLSLTALGLSASCEREASDAGVTARDVGPGAAQILDAFFGLDDALPFAANALCPGGGGMDGMPVTFSRRVGVDAPEADAFRVTTRAGRVLTPRCATLRPALAPTKRHTVLLIGDLGDATDPPVRVEVVGSVPLLAGGDALGLVSPPVTPLADGPSLRLAYRYAPESLTGSACPAATRQVVQLTWAGGVTALSGAQLGDAERARMRVTLEGGAVAQPIALADLGDNDNYTWLCLDTAVPAASVSVEAGVAADPRRDANPETTQRVIADPEAIPAAR